MLWDEQFFYIYAELDEPHVWATITKKNEVMFHDNDFEVFIDPEGSNHHYHEFEMNALGTIWELSLDKPYRDGGPVHDPDNLPGLRSAADVRGTLNNPADTDQGWSAEVAFPWAGLKKFARRMPPVRRAKGTHGESIFRGSNGWWILSTANIARCQSTRKTIGFGRRRGSSTCMRPSVGAECNSRGCRRVKAHSNLIRRPRLATC